MLIIDTSLNAAGRVPVNIGAGGGQVDLQVVDMRFYACVCRCDIPASGDGWMNGWKEARFFMKHF